MQRPTSYHLKRILSNGYTWAVLAGSFFIGSGWLMENNDLKAFRFADKYGKQQSGSPEMLYWLGGGMLALAALRAVVFRMKEIKEFRAKTGDTLLPGE